MEFEDYLKLIKDHENEYLFLTKLRVVDALSGIASDYTNKQLDNLMNNIACYWIDADFADDNDLYKFVILATDNNLEDADADTFYNRMDALVEHAEY